MIGQVVNVVSEKASDFDKENCENPIREHDHADDAVSKGRKEIKPKIFPCPNCGKMFAQYPSSTKHCKEKDSICLSCPVCGKFIKEKRNMKRHLDTHKVAKQTVNNVCEGCEQIFSTKQKLNDHMVTKHNVLKTNPKVSHMFKCTVCVFSHIKASVVKGHISRNHNIGSKLFCNFCDYSCLSRSGMSKHIRMVHKVKSIVGDYEKTVQSDSMGIPAVHDQKGMGEEMYQHTALFFENNFSRDKLVTYRDHVPADGPLPDDKPSAPPPVLPHYGDGTASSVNSVDSHIPPVIGLVGQLGPRLDLVVDQADDLAGSISAVSSLPSLSQPQLQFARKSLPTARYLLPASKSNFLSQDGCTPPLTPIQNEINLQSSVGSDFYFRDFVAHSLNSSNFGSFKTDSIFVTEDGKEMFNL